MKYQSETLFKWKKKENNQRIAEPVFSVMRFLGKERIHKFKVKRF